MVDKRTANKSGSSDIVPKKNIAREGELTIRVGQVYREKNGGKMEVIPFFVDFASAQVQFAEVGKSREDRMRTSDFLNRFEFQGAASASNEVVEKKDLPKKPEVIKKGF